MTAPKAKSSKAGPLDGIGDGRIVVVADYSETFEIREDKKTLRKSPALYSKWYGAANDEPSACYMRRIDKLTRRPDGLLLEGGWGRILRAASNHERTFRGFLTNDRGRAATVAEVAEGILFSVESTAAEILLGLLDVGLIRVEAEPDWDRRRAELDARAETARDSENDGASKAKTSRQKKTKTGRKKAASRKNPDAPGNFRKRSPNLTEPNLTEPNGMANGKSTIGESNGMTTEADIGEPKAGEPKAGEPKAGEPKAGEPKPLPGEPPKSTLEGSASRIVGGPPRDSEGPGIIRLADALPRAVDGLTHGYALRADAFASEIFALLQCPMDRESLDGRRELGNFRAALLGAIDGGLSPGQLDEIIDKAGADAERIGRKRKRYYANGGSPEQYWRFQFGKHVDARRGRRATGTG